MKKFLLILLLLVEILYLACDLAVFKPEEVTVGEGVAQSSQDYIPLVVKAKWSRTSTQVTVEGPQPSVTHAYSITDTVSVDGRVYFEYVRDNGVSYMRLENNNLYIIDQGEFSEDFPLKPTLPSKTAAEELTFLRFGVQPDTEWPITSGSEESVAGTLSWTVTGKFLGIEDVYETVGVFVECAKFYIMKTTTFTSDLEPTATWAENTMIWVAPDIGFVKVLTTKKNGETIVETITSLLDTYSIPDRTKVYKISGLVTDGLGGGIDSVLVTLTGDSTYTVTTDSLFVFHDIPKSSYTIVPFKKGYLFEPESRQVNVAGQDISGQNFTGTFIPDTYSVSGIIADAAGFGIENVLVTLAGDSTYTTTSDSLYLFTLIPKGAYTLTPTRDGYLFDPPGREITVADENLVSLDFTGAPEIITHAVAGSALDSEGFAVEDVLFTLAGDTTFTVTAAGAFTFSGIPDGDYTLTPSKENWVFDPLSHEITLAGADISDQDFTGAPLPPTFSITGTITDAGGTAFPDVTVTIANGEVYTTASGADGSYEYSGLPNGAYTVTPLKDGYTFEPAERELTIADAGVSGLDFTGTVLPPPTYAISGIVRDAANTGIADVAVSLSGVGVYTTGADGSFLFVDVPNGAYTLTPSLAEYTFDPPARSVTVADENVANQDFTGSPVIPTFSVSGIVRDAAGTGLANVSVSLSGVGVYTTGADGAFVFPNVPNGTYTVTPSLTGYTFDPPARSLIVAGANTASQDFTGSPVIPTYTVSGIVRDAANTGIANVSVSLSGVGAYTTGADGGFVFSNVPNGTYTVTPSLTDYTFDPPARSVIVASANTASQDFTGSPVIPTYTVSGIVRDAANTGIANVSVSLSGVGAYTTGADGGFVFSNVPNGSYTLTPSLADHTFDPPARSVTVAGANAANQDFTGNPVIPTYTISGIVRDTAGTGIANVSVSLSGGGAYTTGADGSYLFADIPNGSYTVTPSLADYTFDPPSLSVTVAGANAANQDFTGTPVPRTFSVSGTVTDTDGNGVENVVVTLTGGASSTTDASGQYVFADVLEGTYTVTPSLFDHYFDSASRQVTVSGADVAGVNFTVHAVIHAFAISGTILDSGGTPLANIAVSLSSGETFTTGSNGLYTFPDMPEGSYTVTAEHPNYAFAPPSQQVTLSGADATGVNFTGTLLTYAISGAAIDAQSAKVAVTGGIPGVTISLSNGMTAITGEDGEYIFTGVPNGAYTLTAEKDSYSFEPESATLTVAGENITGLNFLGTLHTFSISGSVTAALAAKVAVEGGIPGVLVSLSTGMTVMTDEGGAFIFTGLPNGTYTITLSLENYAFATESFEVVVSWADVTGLNVTGTLLTYSISGTITDVAAAKVSVPDDLGIGGVEVTLIGSDLTSRSFITDSDGIYHFDNLLNGLYLVTPAKDRYVFDPEHREVVVKDTDAAGQDFLGTYQPPTFSIAGTVTTSGGTGIAGAAVSLSSSDGAVAGATVTDANGQYLFSDILEGTWTVAASHFDYTLSPVQRDVTLSGADMTGQDFVGSLLLFTISGTVKNAANQAIEGVSITLSSGGISVTSANGYYEFIGIPNGAYTLTPAKFGHSFSPAILPVVVSGGNATGQNFVATMLTFNISGTVRDTNGVGMADVAVSLSNGSIFMTDATGVYFFTAVPAGNYTIIPSKLNHEFGPTVRSVTLDSAGATGQDFVGSLMALEISGTVTDTLGVGIPDVVVVLSTGDSLMTASDGGYVFSDLLPGAYIVKPHKVDLAFTPIERSVVLTTSSATGQDFVGSSAAKYTISGHVLQQVVVKPALPMRPSGIEGVLLTLTGAGTPLTCLSDEEGYYEFTDIPNGQYTVTPTYVNFTYTPEFQEVTVNGEDVVDINFMSVYAGASVSGRIAAYDDAPIQGVNVTMQPSIGSPVTVPTDASGQYSFSAVHMGYTNITPSLAGYDFDPVNLSFLMLYSDVTDQDFLGGVSADTYTVSGTITNGAPDYVGIYGVEVVLTGAGDPLTHYTDESGVYAFSCIPNGSYVITPSKVGFEFVRADTSSASYIALDVTGSDNTNNDFVSQQYTISGYVLPPVSKAAKATEYDLEVGIAGVLVTLTGGGTPLTQVTNVDGYYEFANIINGQYTVTPTHTNYTFSPEFQDVTVSGENVVEIYFFGTFTGYSVSGRIAVYDDSPLQDVEVTLEPELSPPVTVLTDSSGQYSFSGLDSDSATITPDLEEYNFDPEFLSIEVSDSDVTDQDFLGGDYYDTYTVSGTITTGEPDYEGIEDVTVVLTGSGMPITRYTDDSGEYVFSCIPDGEYVITPSMEGLEFVDAEIVSNSYINIGVVGTDETDNDFITKRYSISGTIRDVKGNFVSIVPLVLSGDSDDSVMADQDAVYTFENLTPGSYTVEVDPEYTGVTITPSSIDVTITVSDETAADFALSYSIEGYVDDYCSQPLEGITVRLSDLASTVTDADGHYIFTDLGRGTYNMWVDDPSRDFPSGLIYINLQNKSDVNFQEYTPASVYTISGKLVGSDGIEGVLVDLMFEGEPFMNVHSDSQGFYVFTAVPGDEYTVVPIKPSFSFPTAPAIVSGADVSVPDITGTYPQNIVSGFVFNIAQESPAFGAPVGLFDLSMELITPVVTDNWGFYAFTAIPDGDYYIVFGVGGFMLPIIRISVSGGNVIGQTAELAGGEV